MPRKKQQPEDETVTTTAAVVEIPDEEIPSFEVVERRILYGDTSALAGPAMELVNQPERMALYWGNTGREGRHFQLTKRKGWMPVKMTELANRLDVGGDVTESPDGFVTRGEKGREVLYKMPLRLYEALEKRKVADNLKQSRSASRLKSNTQERMTQDADSGALSAGQREHLLRGAERMNRMTVDLNESAETVDLE